MSDQSNTLSKLLELQKSKSNGQINDNLEKRRQEALLKKEQFIKAHSPISTKWPRSHSTPDIKLKQSKLSFTPEESENEETKITINIELFSKNEFLLKTNVFPGALIREAFIMSGGVYNYQEYAWILPISQYQHFKHTLKDFKNVSYVEIPEFVTKGLLAPKITYSKYAPIRYENERIRSLEEDLPSEINERLYQFQREGVRFALEHHGRVLIGDEMGVGKTIQGVSIAACYRDEWPVLIICPASMKLN